MQTLGITGAINSTDGSNGNPDFVLSQDPGYLQLFKNGLLQIPGVAYSLVGLTVSFLPPYFPITGSTLLAIGDGSSGPTPPPPPAPVLVSEIMYRALRLAGVVGAPGRGPSDIQLNEAFNFANAMLDSWNTERLIIYQIERNVQTLIPGQQDYTIGVGGDFNLSRPSRIERAGLIYLSNAAQPLEIPLDILTVAGWSNIPVKNVQSTIPLQMYYQASYPLGIIHLWPLPTMVNQIALYLWSKISQFGALTDLVSFPEGYLRAITYNLAVELCSLPWEGHKIKPSPLVGQIAVDSKAKIKALNIGIIDIGVDQALLSTRDAYYNIYTDSWKGGPY